jgi:hypothetical protein
MFVSRCHTIKLLKEIKCLFSTIGHHSVALIKSNYEQVHDSKVWGVITIADCHCYAMLHLLLTIYLCLGRAELLPVYQNNRILVLLWSTRPDLESDWSTSFASSECYLHQKSTTPIIACTYVCVYCNQYVPISGITKKTINSSSLGFSFCCLPAVFVFWHYYLPCCILLCQDPSSLRTTI